MFQPRNFFLIMEFTIGSTFYHSILMWYPYYFNIISYASYSSTITIIYCATFPIGALISEQLFKKYSNFVNHICILSIFLIFLLQVTFFLINKINPEGDITLYLILSGFTGLLLGGPVSRLFGSDMA